ncbi:MAG: helix-turn-helix domain-containing protein [Erysipelotrichaceae bacterium]|nr:helix-turn-helix domain-containing protein [Erysipelotrichaceae bacterium]
MSTIGERLKILRKEAGLSQKQVAETLKMSKPIVSQYESNQRKPSLGKLIRFSRFYNASLDYICGNVDEKGELLGDIEALLATDKKYQE